jgi:holo-[acyl-carrier protein] synthase
MSSANPPKTQPQQPAAAPPLVGGVLGVGVDLVEVERVRQIYERHGEAFLEKVFTPQERAYCMAQATPWASLAARWAAKEAVAKAFGTGFNGDLGFKSIGVVCNAAGAPQIVLDERATALLHVQGGKAVRISLTHTAALAQAFAVLI